MAEESSSNEQMVTLVSRDDQKFELPVEAAKLSTMVKDALNKGDDDENNDDGNMEHREVPVVRVSSDCLDLVCRYLKHHLEEPMNEIQVPLAGNALNEVIGQEWYRNFVSDMSRETLFELITAANYMDIKPLLDLACVKMTFELTGKNEEEIRVMLNLPALTPEEEEKARKEHAWIFETV